MKKIIIFLIILLFVIVGLYSIFNRAQVINDNNVTLKSGYFINDNEVKGQCEVTITETINTINKEIVFHSPDGRIIGNCTEITGPGISRQCIAPTCDSEELLNSTNWACGHKVPRYSCIY